jgi:hypothetical protein
MAKMIDHKVEYYQNEAKKIKSSDNVSVSNSRPNYADSKK